MPPLAPTPPPPLNAAMMCNLRVLLRTLGNARHEDGKRITLRVRSTGSAFHRNFQSTNEDYAEADKNLILHLLFSECSPSLAQLFSIDYIYASVILSIYALYIACHLLAL